MDNLSQAPKSDVNHLPFSTPADFSGLYQRTHLAVFRYLFGLTGGSQGDAEDLTAETFLRAWKARDSYHGEESMAIGWLLKIARRLMIDAYRRNKTHPEAQDIDPTEIASDKSNPEETALDGENRVILLRLLRSLADGPREMLVLRYLLGWQVQQIAAQLDLPENTVSVTIRRSLKRLRLEWPQPQEM